jgi:hypothetical protein
VATGVEHYVTIFDSNFVLSGLALHASLVAHGAPFRLWVLATDDLAIRQLERLALPHLSVIPLREVETPELLSVKGGRTVGEYCWTLTPFAPAAVFQRDPSVERVTYLDADLYFFDSPAGFLEELDGTTADVLVTEHAYAPEYDKTALSGRFCVQFLTFRNTPGGREVMRWWQDRCIEWCFDRNEEGRFGDQKYLERWPELFPSRVHVLRQVERTLAPWNVDHFSRRGEVRPVFFHMQGFRILGPTRVKLYHGFRVHPSNRWIYDAYLAEVVRAATRLRRAGFAVPTMPEHRRSFREVRRLVLRLLGRTRLVELPRPLGSEPAGASGAGG